MRTVIGSTDKKSTAYTWASKARAAGKADVKVTKSDDGFYTVDAEYGATPDPVAAVTTCDRSDHDHTSLESARACAAGWAIPTPDYEPEMKVERRIREIGTYIASHNAKVGKLAKDLKWRETRAPHLVEKYRQLISDEMELIELAGRELPALQVELDSLKRARHEVVVAFWDRVDAKVRPQVAGRSENSDLYITPTGRGGFRVELATGKVLTGRNRETGEEFEYPEVVFGYDARVDAPQEEYGKTFDDRIMKPANPSWGSYSTNTVAGARTKMHVYEAAIELAVLVNTLLGLGVEGTDR